MKIFRVPGESAPVRGGRSRRFAFGRLSSAATLGTFLLVCPVSAQEPPDERAPTRAGEAQPQTAPTPTPKREPQLGRSENVFVTATRSERSVEDIPVRGQVVSP